MDYDAEAIHRIAGQSEVLRAMLSTGEIGKVAPKPYTRAGIPRGARMTMDERERQFWSRATVTTGGCWEYNGAKTAMKYGRVGWIGEDGRHVSATASRIAWIITRGPISSSKMQVCHKCDNPSCYRPDHLFVGTAAINQADMMTKGRHWHPIGGLGGQAKLTPSMASLIRRLRAETTLYSRDIADIVGCSRSAVNYVLNGGGWKHIVGTDTGLIDAFAEAARKQRHCVKRGTLRHSDGCTSATTDGGLRCLCGLSDALNALTHFENLYGDPQNPTRNPSV